MEGTQCWCWMNDCDVMSWLKTKGICYSLLVMLSEWVNLCQSMDGWMDSAHCCCLCAKSFFSVRRVTDWCNFYHSNRGSTESRTKKTTVGGLPILTTRGLWVKATHWYNLPTDYYVILLLQTVCCSDWVHHQAKRTRSEHGNYRMEDSLHRWQERSSTYISRQDSHRSGSSTSGQ